MQPFINCVSNICNCTFTHCEYA